MELYLDMCAWKRPWDRVDHERVRLEALAVAALVEAAATGAIAIVSSEILEAENSRNPDPARRAEVESQLRALVRSITLDDAVAARAREIESLGVRPLDALHVASAEAGGCAYLVTTDDRMRQRLVKSSEALRVRVVDPIEMNRILEGRSE